LTSVCRRQRFSCVRGRAAVVAEEEAGSSGVDDGKGDRQGLREFWDEKRNDTGRDTIYRFKNISNGFEIQTEAILV
jgi:hypothetical protein